MSNTIKHNFSPEQNAEIILLYNNSIDVKAIAKRFGCSRKVMIRVFKSLNIKIRSTKLEIAHHKVFGKKFGHLSVERFDEQSKKYFCRCDCGGTRLVKGFELWRKVISHCGCKNIYSSLDRGESSKNSIISSYRLSAKKRGLVYELDNFLVETLFKDYCYYCNSPPTTRRKLPGCFGSFIFNGIDRVDNKKGYTLENSVPCCKFCNQSKGVDSVAKFLTKIEQIYNHNIYNNIEYMI